MSTETNDNINMAKSGGLWGCYGNPKAGMGWEKGWDGEQSGKAHWRRFHLRELLEDNEGGVGERVKGRREEGHSRQRQGSQQVTGDGKQHSSPRALHPGICAGKAGRDGELSRGPISWSRELSQGVWTSII